MVLTKVMIWENRQKAKKSPKSILEIVDARRSGLDLKIWIFYPASEVRDATAQSLADLCDTRRGRDRCLNLNKPNR